jgi:hypothetical protein
VSSTGVEGPCLSVRCGLVGKVAMVEMMSSWRGGVGVLNFGEGRDAVARGEYPCFVI